MRTLRLFKQLPVWLLGALLSMGAGAPVYAVDDLGLFQLDGNAVDSGGVGDDWETLCDPDQMGPPYTPAVSCRNEGGGPAGSAFVFTGIIDDPAPDSIYTGGSKDILPFSKLGHTDGSVPDKNEITNAYAAAYLYENDPNDPIYTDENGDPEDQLIVYFGADRIANAGDAFLGFWFFKNNVALNEATGEFIGERSPGDTLVLVNFPQANTAVPLVQVVVWDPTCSKAANNNPQPGQCAATNLKLLFGASGAGAVCTSEIINGVDFGIPGAQPACAISNDEGGENDPTPAPWPYTSKDGFVQQFPYETFFSGGINLTELVGSDTCFSSFMAETRSSSSFTAQLKDLVVGDFPLCDTNSVTKIWKDIEEDGDRSNDVEIPHQPDAAPINLNDVIVGDLIYDEVIVSGSALGGDLTQDPTGDVLFTLYATANCSDEGINGTTMIPDGEGGMEEVFGELVSLIDDAEDGTAHAYSTSVEILATGDYSWRATYLGDDTFPLSVSACESFNVIQPFLSITKDIISCDADSGEFAVSVDGNGTTIISDLLSDDEVSGPHGLNPGIYTVRETVQDAYVAVYDPSSDCSETASAGVQSVSLDGTDDFTCSFINVRKPQVTVIKVVDGTPGTFDLRVGGVKVNLDSPTQGSTLIHTLVGNNFGAPTVSEVGTNGTNTGDYSTVIQCDDGTSDVFDLAGSPGTNEERSATLQTLEPGDHVTCTITNISPDLGKACLSTP